MLQGSSFSAILSPIATVSAEWAPLTVVGTYVALLTTPFQLGPILTMPVSSLLCQSSILGWPAVYYLQGGLTVVLLVLFHLLYWERPDSPGSLASVAEIEVIRRGRDPKGLVSKPSTPTTTAD